MSVRQLVAMLGRGVVPSEEPVVRADDLGVNRGDGVFDAARVVADADGVRVDHLAPHLDARPLRSDPEVSSSWRDWQPWARTPSRRPERNTAPNDARHC